jgi:cation diffusion facilitator CzcD-associated flavoprotein CzcO
MDERADLDRIETGTVVIGAGFSGLGMAIRFRMDGRTDFVVLEKAGDLGGTWLGNTYPGCGCDIPSHVYSYSFAQNPGWTHTYPPQREILAYLNRLADRYQLREAIRFGVEMTSARWDADESRWHVTTSTGQVYVAQFLVTAIGSLHIPYVPRLPGLERFTGAVFHSSRWDHDLDLTGKRVAVIGTGSSAVQFVPKIAEEVGKLHLFQRTPAWILPKSEAPTPRWLRAALRWVPGLQRAYRALLYWQLEARAIPFNYVPALIRGGQTMALRHMHRSIADPALRAKLTPNYKLGCKRVVMSDDFYPALCRDNVELVTDWITEVGEDHVVDTAGVRRQVDAIIFGTGFHVTDAFHRQHITGRDGRDLGSQWRDGGNETHLGITTAGYPNLFFLLGPNTTVGHNSTVFMIESQIRYVAKAIRYADRTRAGTIEVTRAAQDRYQADIQRRLVRGVWNTGCDTWFLDSKGVNRALWPGFSWQYRLRTRTFDPADYQFTPAPSRQVPVPAFH